MRNLPIIKVCVECKQSLSRIADFYPRTRANTRFVTSRCKVCANKRSVDRYKKKHYGLSPEQIQVLIEVQNFKCAICGNTDKLCVDHCHKTGRIRGMLCRTCNSAIGQLKEDSAIIRRAATYVEEK